MVAIISMSLESLNESGPAVSFPGPLRRCRAFVPPIIGDIREGARSRPSRGRNVANNLAFLYQSQARYPDAERLHKRALAARERALGSDHANVATSLNNLGLLYANQGRYADAEPLYKRAVATFEKALGRDHPEVAISLNNLALLYLIQSRYAEAQPLLQRSLAIREKVLGRDHPVIAQSLNNMAFSIPGPRSPCRCRAFVATILGNLRKGARSRPSRPRDLTEQPGFPVPGPGPLRRRRAFVAAFTEHSKRRSVAIIPISLNR